MNELKEMLAYTGINVEQLVDDYTETLHTYGNPWATREASIIALKEWATAKEWLIKQVMKMPNYNGNLQSVIDLIVPNITTYDKISNAVGGIWNRIFLGGNAVLSKKNDDGKTIENLIAEEVAQMPSFVNISNLVTNGGKSMKSYEEFDCDGYTKKSKINRNKANRLIIYTLREYSSPRLDKDMSDTINSIMPEIRSAENMKTTRAMGKIIKAFGLEDKSAGSAYTKEYIANYCELMKEDGIKLQFVISVNPIDYLKMSIGDFTSCHDIRGGGWRSGTISYMLDKVSMITYAIRPNSVTEPDSETGVVYLGKDRPELFSKVYRNVFHWDEHFRLIQSRVYPQGNEGCIDLYKVFRNAVQTQLSLANDLDPNTWTNRKRKYMNFTRAGERSTNYADWSYEHFSGNLSTPGHADDPYYTGEMVIGAEPTCIICGRKHNRTNRLKCGYC